MENVDKRIVLTGFMGVGKSTVARHLSNLSGQDRIDLDDFIEQETARKIPEIVEIDGIEKFREIETENLEKILKETNIKIISLGGGAWTTAKNRHLIKKCGCVSVWLGSTFEHCWRNIRFSRRERPLVKNKTQARKLFEERERVYCLADWHFVINPGHNSYEVAGQIAKQILLAEIH